MKNIILCVLFFISTIALSSQSLPGTSLEISLDNYNYKSASNSYINYDNNLIISPMYFRENITSVLNKLIKFKSMEHLSINESKVSDNKVIVTVKWKDFEGGIRYYLIAGNEIQTTVLAFYYYSNLTTVIQLNDLLNLFFNSRIIDMPPSNDMLFEYSIKIPKRYKILYLGGLSYSFDTEEKKGIPVLVVNYNPLINIEVSLKIIANIDVLDDRYIIEKTYKGLNREFQYWQGIFKYDNKVVTRIIVKAGKTKYIQISRQMFDEDYDTVEMELHEIVDSINKKELSDLGHR